MSATARQITPLSDEERQIRVAARVAELMREAGHGAYLEPGGPAWTQIQIDARNQAMASAQAAIELEHGVASWKPRDAADDVDWSVSPREGLKRALVEYNEALRLRDNAGEVARRAAERVAACEVEAARFASLDNQIEQFHVDQLRANSEEPMPWSMRTASRDRSIAMDRLEHSEKARQKLEAELRDAERAAQQKLQICHLWATRILMNHADDLAAAWRAAQDEADRQREVLNALGYAHFRGQTGPAPVSQQVREVINAQLKPAEQNFPLIEPLMTKWLRAHARLLGDSDSPIDVG